jgi:hypothetical protein
MLTQWWELAIPALAGLLGGLGGAGVSGWLYRRAAIDVFQQEADERRRTRFMDERREAYARFLAALKEWEPLRDRDWRLKAEADEPSLTPDQREDAMRRWEQSRQLTEPFFFRLREAEQTILLLASRRVRDLTTYLFVESCRGGKTGLLMQQYLQAIRLDLGTDSDLQAAGSPLLEAPGIFRDDIPSAAPEDA